MQGIGTQLKAAAGQFGGQAAERERSGVPCLLLADWTPPSRWDAIERKSEGRQGVGTRFSKRSGHASLPPPPKKWLSQCCRERIRFFVTGRPSDLRHTSKSGHSLALHLDQGCCIGSKTQ